MKDVIKKGFITYTALPYPAPASYADTLIELGNECIGLRKQAEATLMASDCLAYDKAVKVLDKYVDSIRTAFGERMSRKLFPIVGEAK